MHIVIQLYRHIDVAHMLHVHVDSLRLTPLSEGRWVRGVVG